MLDGQAYLPTGINQRGREFITRLARELGIPVCRKIERDTEFLFLWGPGGKEQLELAKTWKGIVVMFDLGYFYRRGIRRKGCLRMTINNAHPQEFLDIAGDGSRWANFQIPMHDWYTPKGRILLCGMGPKSRIQYGYHGSRWENDTFGKLKKIFPGERVYYRPKPSLQHEHLPGTQAAGNNDIDFWLQGAKLVVCHHSNVAVDCAIQGVPCVCSDGIGAALWSKRIGTELFLPTKQERLQFLEKVSWFDWTLNEAPQLAAFLNEKRDHIREIAYRLRAQTP